MEGNVHHFLGENLTVRNFLIMKKIDEAEYQAIFFSYWANLGLLIWLEAKVECTPYKIV